MWIEMFTPQKALEIPRTILKEAPPVEIEIRYVDNIVLLPLFHLACSIIVWGARSLSFRGLKKDSIDAQIMCNIDCSGYSGSQDIQQLTDVHYFSRNGNAIFNWRVVYSKVRLPISTCVLQISAYDFRILGPAVFVGEVRRG